MAHDVFLSYSSKDKVAADSACHVLERNGVRVWMAPRDLPPGDPWAATITGAINGARALVLVVSDHANVSHFVSKEVSLAADRGIPFFPIRLTDVKLAAHLAFHLAGVHWIDALTPPIETQFEKLAQAVKQMLDSDFGRDIQPGRLDEEAVRDRKAVEERLRAAEAEAAKKAEAQRRLAEAESARLAWEEQQRVAAADEAARQQAAAEQKRAKDAAVEAAREAEIARQKLLAEEAFARKAAEEAEAQRRLAEAESARLAWEEQQRVAAAAEAAQQQAAAEQKRRKDAAVEAARRAEVEQTAARARQQALSMVAFMAVDEERRRAKEALKIAETRRADGGADLAETQRREFASRSKVNHPLAFSLLGAESSPIPVAKRDSPPPSLAEKKSRDPPALALLAVPALVVLSIGIWMRFSSGPTPFAMTAPPSVAQLVANCDALAALPQDDGLPNGVPGVEWASIDATAAIAACRSAWDQSKTTRILFELGRALYKGGQYQDAMNDFLQSFKNGYAVAALELGSMYQDGDGVPQNDDQSAAYYLQAMKMGNKSLRKEYIDNKCSNTPNSICVAIQTQLISKGLLKGPADGKFGPNTIAALQAWIKP